MSAYTEDHPIEQPAIRLMEHEVGWDSVNAYEPPSSRDAGLRRSGGLTDNSDAAVEELTRVRSALRLVEANREVDKHSAPVRLRAVAICALWDSDFPSMWNP